MKFRRLIRRTGWLLALALVVWIGRKQVRRETAEPNSTPATIVAPQTQLAASSLPLPAQPAGTLPAPVPPSSARSSQLPRQDVLWQQPVPEAAFAQFAEWTRQYRQAAPPAARLALEAEGVLLARERRDELVDLIQAQPARALELAVPFSVRRALSPPVTSLLETRVSGPGSVAVLAALAEPGQEGTVLPLVRRAELGDKTYQAFVYGRRLGEPSRENIPRHGIAVGDLLALSEHPVRLLEPEELSGLDVAATTVLCPICGESADAHDDETVVDVGGERRVLCSGGHAHELNEHLIAAEGAMLPVGVSPLLAASSAWTLGAKNLLLIRVDFPDMTGTPFPDSTGTALITILNAFYRESSYGKTGFAPPGAGSDMTATFRLPQKASDYGTNNFFAKLRTEARAAATAAGFSLSKYHLDVICFGQAPGWTWAGLGYVGGAGAWLRNSFSTGVAAHELGHNFGLNHANFWDTSEQSVIGPGSSIEYGDKFDTMGSAAAGQKHFNARYKNYLNWIAASEVATATTNGLYRIFPQDVANVVGPRALKIVKNSRTNYWVEFRQKYTSNKWLMSGAGLRWAGNGNEHSNLLDTSPGSAGGKDDSAILLGRTFSDWQTGIHLTVVGKNGTTPESLQVFVNRGTFPMNLPPLLVLTAGGVAVLPGASVQFDTMASDPNGDALAFAWDFGDGNFTNGPAATYRWSAAGHYLVRCTATDMKGGAASDSVLIRVGSPTTFLISGRVTADGAPLQDATVYVSSSKVAFTDSQGNFTLTGLAAGSYTVNARREGFAFIHPGFTNPVRVGPKASQINFEALPQEGQDTVPLIVAGAVWQYLDDGANQGTLWKELSYDASAWKEGPAQLGYGDRDVSTVVSYGLDPDKKYITAYFRHSFTVTDPSTLAAVSLGLVRDDGAVVYLNGRELFRSNLPGGSINHRTLASSTIAGEDE